MEHKVKLYIHKYNLLQNNEKVIVGLSGGSDSVALLLVLKSLGYQVFAAHCNFHLRGEESVRDEQFVSDLCERQQVTLFKRDFDTLQYASAHGMSVEMAARELRYDFFRELMKSMKIAHTAVAHHQDDQAETLLINLIRGTGIHGLRGMLPRNGAIIRPLLCVSRQEILDYLGRLGQSYVTDSTNLQPDFLRNKIRLELIPWLKSLNPSVVKGLNHTAENLRNAELVYQEALASEYRELILTADYQLGVTPVQLRNIGSVMKSANLRCAWYEILAAYGFHPAQIEESLAFSASSSGKMLVSPSWKLLVNRDILEITPRTVEEEFISLTIQDTTDCIELHDQVLYMKTLKVENDFPWSSSSFVACLDKDKLRFPLTLRPWKAGDKFIPLGMTGRKLVSDFLTDLKLSLWEKQKQLVLCDSRDEILWVIGRRISNKVALSSRTQTIFQLELQAKSPM